MAEISDEELARLEADSELLDALYAQGVENWEGFELAVDDVAQATQERLSIETE